MLIQSGKAALRPNLTSQKPDREKETTSFDNLLESSRANKKTEKNLIARAPKKEKPSETSSYDNPSDPSVRNEKKFNEARQQDLLKKQNLERNLKQSDENSQKLAIKQDKNQNAEQKSVAAIASTEIDPLLIEEQKAGVNSENPLLNKSLLEEEGKLPLSTNLSENLSKTLEKKGLEDKGLLELGEEFQMLPPAEMKGLNGQLQQPKIMPDAKLTGSKMNSLNSTAVNDLLNIDNQGSAKVQLAGDFDSSSFEEEGSNLKSTENIYFDQDLSQGLQEVNNFETPLVQAMGKDNSEAIENMQSIVQQARTFVDEGGGSMEIHLQPEGMGKVHLKVAVEDGHVSVQMLTDNAVAKRALEESLFEIRNSLEGHKLLVDTLKVEMSQDYQKDFSDFNRNMQEQANRDFAEQFLGQFREERDQKMGGLLDGFRNYQRNAREPDMILNERNPYVEKGKGQTINLVA